MIFNKSTISEQTKDSLSGCVIVIDNCSHSNQFNNYFEEIKDSLSNIFSNIHIATSICEKPEQLLEIIKKYQIKSVVIIGYRNKEHITKYKSTNTSIIPPSQIQIVDIRLLNAYQNDIDVFKQIVYIAAIQSILSSDIEQKPIHKPFKFNNKVSRRNLFRAVSTTLKEYVDTPIYQKNLCDSLIDSCPHCINSCQYGSITKKDSNIIILDESCVKCGACCVSCPTGALQLPDLTNNQIISILESVATDNLKKNSTQLLFTCNQTNEEILKQNLKVPKNITIIQIPCIAVLGFIHAILSASYGIMSIALCPNNFCKQKNTLTFARTEISLAHRLLKETGTAFTGLIMIESHKLENINNLFNQLFEKTQSKSNIPFINKKNKRSLLLSTLSEIAPTIDTIFNEKISPFFDIEINSKLCTMCDACSIICPTTALKSIIIESSIELSFWPRKCVGCYACVNVCPESCINVKGKFIPKNIIEHKKDVKIRDSITMCHKCGEPIGCNKKIKNIEKILVPTKNSSLLKALYLCRKCKSL